MSYVVETLDEVVSLAAIQQQNLERYPYLLESIVHEYEEGNHSFLFLYPQEIIECTDKADVSGFLEELEQRYLESRHDDMVTQLPYIGGWLVYLGYETVQGIETSLACPDFAYDFPVAFAARCPACIIVDHKQRQTHCLAESGFEDLLAVMLEDLQRPAAVLNEQQAPVIGEIQEDDPAQYVQGVERILEYIRAGDIFQANLSRAWSVVTDNKISADNIYRHLSAANPAPFACLVHHNKGNIISSSPERLVRIQNGVVETRPIAGTRPRTHDDQDMQWLHELRTDDKERAEHIMLIDLERNDLGRVCSPGTITVDELMTLESYAHVHHIVSNISGRLRHDVTPVDAIRAVFPGGTITGCPKVRCMQILAELEHTGRGPYTGSIGYISHHGNIDFNILIRTIFSQDNRLSFRAGAGIVADSIATKELDETRHKARGMLLALGAV